MDLTAQDFQMYGVGAFVDRDEPEENYPTTDRGAFKRPAEAVASASASASATASAFRNRNKPPSDQRNALVNATVVVDDNEAINNIFSDVKFREKNINNVTPRFQSSTSGKRTLIPYDIQNAAQTLLRAALDREVNFDQEVIRLLRDISSMDHEYIIIDPWVRMTHTISTGACNIYMEEHVPVSVYICALHFNMTFTVTIFEGEEPSSPQKYGDVTILPFTGEPDPSRKMQPFGVAKQVARYLNEDQKKMVEFHFAQVLGPMSPRDACDGDFIEEQRIALAKTLNNVKNGGGGAGGAGSGTDFSTNRINNGSEAVEKGRAQSSVKKSRYESY